MAWQPLSAEVGMSALSDQQFTGRSGRNLGYLALIAATESEVLGIQWEPSIRRADSYQTGRQREKLFWL